MKVLAPRRSRPPGERCRHLLLPLLADLIAHAEVTFADGTSKTVPIEGVEDGSHVLAGVDLTDENIAVRRVHVHGVYLLFYHRLRFYSGLPPGS